MSNDAASAKVCSMCGQDVSGKPRSKDAQGRYVCANCLKGKAPEGVAKAQTKSKASAGEDNAFLLDLGGKPLAITLCPSCQQPMKDGAKLCTFCGFDMAEGKAIKTRVSKEKAAKERAAVGAPMGPGTKLFLAAFGPTALAAGMFIGTGDTSAGLAMVVLNGLIGLAAWIWAVVVGFKTGLLHGILMIVTLGLWGLYFVFFAQEDTKVKGFYGGSLAGGVVVAIAQVMAPGSEPDAIAPRPPGQTSPRAPQSSGSEPST